MSSSGEEDVIVLHGFQVCDDFVNLCDERYAVKCDLGDEELELVAQENAGLAREQLRRDQEREEAAVQMQGIARQREAKKKALEEAREQEKREADRLREEEARQKTEFRRQQQQAKRRALELVRHAIT